MVDHRWWSRGKRKTIPLPPALFLTPLSLYPPIDQQEAIRLKEAGHAEEVVAVSVGPKECQVSLEVEGFCFRLRLFVFSTKTHDEARPVVFASDVEKNPQPPLPRPSETKKHLQEQLRTALALGADRVLHIDTTTSSSSGSSSDGSSSTLPPQTPGPRAIASLLARVVAEEGPRLVLLGKQAIDGDSAQTGPMLAGLLNWPQATFASKVVLGESNGGGAETKSLTVTREVDGGLQTLSVPLPAVVTTDLRLNEPRYASLPAVMKSKKAQIPTRTPADLGVDLARFSQQTAVTKISPPPARKPGRKVASVEELVEALVTEAKVL